MRLELGQLVDRLASRARSRSILQPPSLPWAPSSTHGKVKVLLECPPDQSPTIVSTVLERAGLDVVVCEGPTSHERCPLAVGGSCHSVEGVDVVLNMLGDTTPESAEVLPALLGSGPTRPAVVAMTEDPLHLEGTRTVSRRARGPEIVRALHEAIADREAAVPRWGDGV